MSAEAEVVRSYLGYLVVGSLGQWHIRMLACIHSSARRLVIGDLGANCSGAFGAPGVHNFDWCILMLALICFCLWFGRFGLTAG